MKASQSNLRELSRLTTGIEEVDFLLGGGVIMRRIFQMSGRYAVGKSTLACLIVAQAQKTGMEALWLDAENRFPFEYAQKLGVDLERLDYEHGLCAEEYFAITHEWIIKHHGIIVLDSVAALLTRNESEKEDGPSIPEVPKMIPNFLKKVSNELSSSEKECCLVFLNQERRDFDGALKVIGGRAVEHFVTQWLRFRKCSMEPIKRGTQQIGDTIEISMKKDEKMFESCKLELLPNVGFKPLRPKKPKRGH